MSVIFTGMRDYGGELENSFFRLRHYGVDCHVFDTMGACDKFEDLNELSIYV